MAGETQCTWTKEDSSCTLTPPPSDAVFTVIVALLTLILAIPITVALTLTLETYANKWPGKALNEDHVTSMISENKRNDNTETPDTVEQQYFGEVVKKGIATDATKESCLAKESVRFAYNGTYDVYVYTSSSYLLLQFLCYSLFCLHCSYLFCFSS